MTPIRHAPPVKSPHLSHSSAGVRFAPSPTGTFHLGNLRTAWISWRLAQELKTPWVVRFEDIDQPRVLPGAQEKQLQDLARLRMNPDEIILQSDHHDRHFLRFLEAVKAGQVYPCFCSRKTIQQGLQPASTAQPVSSPQPFLDDLASATNGPAPLQSEIPRKTVYTGACRTLPALNPAELAKPEIGWRFRTEDPRFDFLVAKTSLAPHPKSSSSAFRTGAPEDFLPNDSVFFQPAYPWACAWDDFEGDYALRVRAWDLAEAEYAQRDLRRYWGEIDPAPVFHTSLVTLEDGSRLEKRTRGVTLDALLSTGKTESQMIDSLLHWFEQGFESPDLRAPLPFPSGETARTLRVNPEVLPR
jgi:glutamyl-tRNA synthetase